jgi:hypothetical protein
VREEPKQHKPLVDKLGVKPEHRVAVLGVSDPAFLRALMERAADVYVDRRRAGLDMIVMGVVDRSGLRRLRTQRDFIAPNGAVWVVWPKGSKAVNENDVRDVALASGLVDVKVVSFSPTHSALKLVIRLTDRQLDH